MRYFPLPSIPSHFVGGEFVGSPLHVTEREVGCNLSYKMGFCKHRGGNKEVFSQNKEGVTTCKIFFEHPTVFV